VQQKGDWLTYREAAEQLNSTAEAVRYRAIRGRWPRMRGNDGRARIQLPDQPNSVRTPSAQPVRTASEPRSDPALVETLKAQIADLQAYVETLKGQLAAADARDSERLTDLAFERTRTAQAIAAFEAIARRLEAMAEARRPSWWRWLRFAD
jgi:hypothetical protein